MLSHLTNTLGGTMEHPKSVKKPVFDFEFDRQRTHHPKVAGSSPVPAKRYKVLKSNGLVFLNRFFYTLNFLTNAKQIRKCTSFTLK